MYSFFKPKKQAKINKHKKDLELIAYENKGLIRGIPLSIVIKNIFTSPKIIAHFILMTGTIIFFYIHPLLSVVFMTLIYPFIMWEDFILFFLKEKSTLRLFYFINSFSNDFLKNNRELVRSALNNNFNTPAFSLALYKFLIDEQEHKKEIISILLSCIDNVSELFTYIKKYSEKEFLLFSLISKIKENLTETKDKEILDKIVNIYNEEFLTDDLKTYIDLNKDNLNKEIFEHLKLHGARADLFSHFENINRVVDPKQDRLNNVKPQHLEFDLKLNKNYINF